MTGPAPSPALTSLRHALPAYVTGFGLGAFLDGIVFHQVLRWHHLVSAYQPPAALSTLERNMLFDGLFHLAAWAVVTAGVLSLWVTRDRLRGAGRRWLIGGLLVGWGVFNLVDEVVFHLVLGAHHIRMVDNYLVYDLAYSVAAVVLVVVGLRLQRSGAVDAVPVRY